ncbi:MAG: MoaD/ThiS family protein [Gammaproteobacteria bacterium]
MSIKVRYFASLKESVGRSEDIVAYDDNSTVGGVWAKANPNRPFPENVLAAVNMNYAEPDAPVKDGDEVAFFPPVTGG